MDVLEEDATALDDVVALGDRRGFRLWLIPLVGLVMVITVGIVATRGNTPRRVETTATDWTVSPTTVRPSAAPLLSLTTVLQGARMPSVDVLSVNRVEVKQTTWGEFWAAGASAVSSSDPSWLASTREVDVTAIAGNVRPATYHDPANSVYHWRVQVIDATTGSVIMTIEDPQGNWPAFFDTLPATQTVIG